MAGYQAEKRPDIHVLEMTVTGEKAQSHSLSLLMSRSVWRCECWLLCFVLQHVSPSVEHLCLLIYPVDLFIMEMREKYIEQVP